MTGRLVTELRDQGFDARILVTAWTDKDGPEFLPPSSIPFKLLPIHYKLSLKRRWAPLLSFLKDSAPCVFVPNYDFAAAVVSSVLPSKVGIVGTIRSDELVYFNQLVRLGSFWNRVVTVSESLKGKAVQVQPTIAERAVAIPNGISLPAADAKVPPKNGEPIRVLYSGRVVQHQKRVFDLLQVAAALKAKGTSFVMDIAGDGSDYPAFARRLTEEGLADQVFLHGRLHRERLNELYRQAHVFLLVSEFEGMPNSLLEAMAWGCVPVCTRTETGASEVINPERSGFLVEIGAVEAMASAIASLNDARTWRPMSLAARRRIQSAFSESVMFADWAKVICSVHEEVSTGKYQRNLRPMRHVPGDDPISVLVGRARVWAGKMRRKLLPCCVPVPLENR